MTAYLLLIEAAIRARRRVWGLVGVHSETKHRRPLCFFPFCLTFWRLLSASLSRGFLISLTHNRGVLGVAAVLPRYPRRNGNGIISKENKNGLFSNRPPEMSNLREKGCFIQSFSKTTENERKRRLQRDMTVTHHVTSRSQLLQSFCQGPNLIASLALPQF